MVGVMKDLILLRVIELYGGSRALAASLEISNQAVWRWERIPHERARAISKHTGIPLHELRPDVWPPSDEASTQGDTE